MANTHEQIRALLNERARQLGLLNGPNADAITFIAQCVLGIYPDGILGPNTEREALRFLESRGRQ